MTRSSARIHFATAGVLALVLLAFTALPAAAGGAWRSTAAEDLAVRLTNCMRSGGYVTSAGRCKGWGKGRYSVARPSLKRSQKISDMVTGPWAKKSVQFYGPRSCWIGHSRNGSTVEKRLASASFKDIASSENMGCGMYGSGQATVIRMVRLWQTEKSWGGPHWRQIKSPDYRSIGVGVARYGRYKTQIVLNFYGKAVD